MEDNNINVGDLIRFSGQIAEANDVKCDRELMLHQLSVFKNFGDLIKTSKKCDGVLQIGYNIQPGSDGGGDIMSEFDVLVISVQNVSSLFTFDRKYWSIVLQFAHGKVCVWNFKDVFKEGETEKYSTDFYPTFSSKSTTEKIEIHLMFSMQWTGINYTKSFHITSISLDILYFLSPGRRPTSPHALQQFMPASINHSDAENHQKPFPSICRFNLKTDEKLQKIFIREIFLKDTNFSRGFSMGGSLEQENDIVLREPTEYSAYFYEDRIIFSKQDNNTISFRCSNSSVLYLLKDAIYRRLLVLCENRTVKIKSADSMHCDSLYEVKLRLEALEKSVAINFADFLCLYYEFREASESILYFCYSN